MSYTEWQIFNSSAVAAGRYDSIEQTLELQFDSGKVYKYFNVPKSVWLALCRAESKGAFFKKEISERFRYQLTSATNEEVEEDGVTTEFDDEESTSSNEDSFGNSAENPFCTYNRPLAYVLMNGLHYMNSRGETFKLIHKVHCLDHGYSYRFELFIKEEVELPDLSQCANRQDRQKLINEYISSCWGGKVRDFYVSWGSETNCREELLPGSLVYVGTDKSYNDELDDESKWWFIEDWTYLEWPDETQDENFPELSLSARLRNKDVSNDKPNQFRSINYHFTPADSVDEPVRDYRSTTTKAGIAYDKETLEKMGEKIRSLKSTMPIIRPEISPETSQRNGCASVIVISALTVASLYFI
jgi:hypothetical protein